MHSTPRRTAPEARAWLERHGVTVSDWARAHGFEPSVVFALLSGRTHGRRGQAHLAAVALGLKGPAPNDEESPLPTARPLLSGSFGQRMNTTPQLTGDPIMS